MNSSRKIETILFTNRFNKTGNINRDIFLKKVQMTSWSHETINRAENPYTEKVLPAARLTTKTYLNMKTVSEVTSGKIKLCESEITGIAAIANEEIPKECSMIYAGEVFSCPVAEINTITSDYGVTLTPTNKETIHWIDAKRHGNITRFIQHAPAPEILMHYTFHQPEDREKVALPNMATLIFTYEDIPVVMIYPTRKIEKNEILLLDYGLEYWQAVNIVPKLFYRDGKPMDPSSYTINPAAEISFSLPLEIEANKTIFITKIAKLSRAALQASLQSGKLIFQYYDQVSGTYILFSSPALAIQTAIDFHPGIDSISTVKFDISEKPAAAMSDNKSNSTSHSIFFSRETFFKLKSIIKPSLSASHPEDKKEATTENRLC